jgi:hypothetical protein
MDELNYIALHYTKTKLNYTKLRSRRSILLIMVDLNNTALH